MAACAKYPFVAVDIGNSRLKFGLYEAACDAALPAPNRVLDFDPEKDALERVAAWMAPWTVEHVYHLFVVELRRADRDATLEKLREAGVGAGIHYPIPIHLQKAYAELGQGPGSFPVTEAAARRILSLPLYPEMTRDHVDRVALALGRALGR